MTMAIWGFLEPGRYLIHDRDGKFCPAFQQIIDDAGIKRVLVPPQRPNLNAFAERWVRSVKDEALSRLILCGERALRHALKEYVTHLDQAKESGGAIQCHERLGGLLKTTIAKPHEYVTLTRLVCTSGPTNREQSHRKAPLCVWPTGAIEPSR